MTKMTVHLKKKTAIYFMRITESNGMLT